jgi:2-phospho-L-lactate guanylyltransferase
MMLWAIVPVKPLQRAKSRLAGVLNRDQRAELSRRMLMKTLDVLADIPEVEQSLVISRDSKALALARKHRARTLTERGAAELNRALVRATVVARQYGVSAVLVLPADLPLLAREDVQTLIAHALHPPVVAIAPDRHQQGTNALLIAPPGLIEYEFGPGSFARHVEQARAAGARVEICPFPSLALDLDAPDDLALLRDDLPRMAEFED